MVNRHAVCFLGFRQGGILKTIGLISDTHGLVRPEVLAALHGCDLIVHAGDIGADDVVPALRRLAPVVAVRGNVDHGPWCEEFRRTEVVEIDGSHLYVLHDLARLDLDPRAARFQAVVFGHSHRSSVATEHGILYVNPGSAGPRRFRLPVSVARLRVESGKCQAEIVEVLP